MSVPEEATVPKAADPLLRLVPLPRESPAAPQPGDEWNKVRKLALRHLDRFVSCEPKVLRGEDPGAIHNMRVASRRLQQVLDLIYPAPPPREIRRLRRRIRRCRRALGEVRNCDVLLGMVESPLRRKRSSRRHAWAAVQEYLQERRAESSVKAMRKLSKVNLAVLYVHLKEQLALVGPAPHSPQPPEVDTSSEAPAREPFPSQIASTLEEVWSNFEEKIAESQANPRASVIHGVRIAAKRLRYLLEVVQEFRVPGSGEAVGWLRRLQQHLGAWHDLEILEQMVIEMIARPDYLRERLPLVMDLEKLILRGRENKKKLEQKYFHMTQESLERQRLRDWVAYLLASPSAAFAIA